MEPVGCLGGAFLAQISQLAAFALQSQPPANQNAE
jgi:hypothetical protein